MKKLSEKSDFVDINGDISRVEKIKAGSMSQAFAKKITAMA